MTYAQQSDLLAGQIGMSNLLMVFLEAHLFAGLLKMHCTRVAHDVADVSIAHRPLSTADALRAGCCPGTNVGHCSDVG